MPQNDSRIAEETAGVSAARRAAVDRARREWIERLIDPSRNNNLLYFRPLQLATIDLSDAGHDLVDELLGGEAVALDRLVSRERQVRATRSHARGPDATTCVRQVARTHSRWSMSRCGPE